MLPDQATFSWTSLTRFEKLVLSLWLIALLVVCLRSAITPHRQNVFPIFTLAGQNWQEGKPLYGSVTNDRDVFRYSPLTASFFSLWSFFPERLANVLWRLFNAGVLLVGLGWWLRALLPEFGTGYQRGAVFLLVLPLSIPSLNNGQANPLLAGLLLASVAAVAKKRFALAGFCAAVAFWLKLYPLALGLLLVLIARRRFIVWFAGALAFGFVLPFVLQNAHYVGTQYDEWVQYLKSDDRGQLPITLWLKDIRLLFQVWLVPISSGVFHTIQLGTGLGIAGLCWFMQRHGLPRTQVLFFVTNLGCCWMTLFGPSTESTTWVLLGSSLCTCLVLSFKNSSGVPHRLLLIFSYSLFVLSHAAHWFPWGGQLGAVGIQPLAGLLFFASVVAVAVSALQVRVGSERKFDEAPGQLAA